MRRLNRGALTAAVVMATAAIVPVISASPASAHAACGTGVSDKDNSSWDATGGGANMRSGSSTSCGIRDTADSGQRLDYHCYTWGSDGYSWTYLRNDSASPDTYGWVRDSLLADNGSTVYCGF